MEIVRADAMGMCFGVRDALQVIDQVALPEEVTIHGELVHNGEVLRMLDARGFHQSDEVGRDVPETDAVLITAHGVSDRERGRLLDAGKRLIDTTCPLVTKVHDAALRWARPKPLPVCATAVHNAQRLVSDEVFRGNELAGRFASFR